MVAPYAAGSSPAARTSAPAILIPVTNGLERLNGEIKRRTEVVGIFPNNDAIVSSSAPSFWNRTTNGRFSAPDT